MILNRAVETARRSADEHRELIIISVALPLNTAATAWERIKGLGVPKSVPDGHNARLARVRADVKRFAEARRRGEAWAQKPLRTDRKPAASLNTRVADKSESQTVRMSDLTAILTMDREEGVVRLESFATAGDVAKHLDPMGLQLEATSEMKDATMGGLVMALGVTTSTRTFFERSLGAAARWGSLLPSKCGSSLRPPHVRVVYRPFHSLRAYADEYQRLVSEAKPPHFVETSTFDEDSCSLGIAQNTLFVWFLFAERRRL